MNILDKEKINNIARILPSMANAKRILKSLANGSRFSQSCSNGPPAIVHYILLLIAYSGNSLLARKNQI